MSIIWDVILPIDELMFFAIYEMENRKNVPNHQPDMHVYQRLTCIYTNINMDKYFSE